jgi:transcriptional regulator with XRE-family HTH domain
MVTTFLGAEILDVLSAREREAGFAALLRRLRAEARLTQEELAEAAGISPRSVSDLERGISRTAHKETARLLADAFAITGPARTAFVAAARGKAPVCEVLAAVEGLAAGARSRAGLWGPHEDLGLAVHHAKPGQPADAAPATVDTSGAVACIWLVRLTTVIASEMTSSRTGVLTTGAAGAANAVQSETLEPDGQRLPPADRALLALGHALQLALREAVAAALNNDNNGAAHRAAGVWPKEIREVHPCQDRCSQGAGHSKFAATLQMAAQCLVHRDLAQDREQTDSCRSEPIRSSMETYSPKGCDERIAAMEIPFDIGGVPATL